jgi:hypothetical protein
MDLYVKLQGLKYNFKKVWRCFCKIPSTGYFYLIIGLFFFWKSGRIGLWSHGLGPWFWLMSACHSRSLLAVDSLICGLDFIKTEGYQQSNPGPLSTSGRLTSNPADGAAHRSSMAAPWWGLSELCLGVFEAKRRRGRRGPYRGWNTAGNNS